MDGNRTRTGSTIWALGSIWRIKGNIGILIREEARNIMILSAIGAVIKA